MAPKDWQKYKAIRLEALLSDPQAFGSNHKKEAAYSEEKWRARLHQYSPKFKQWQSQVTDGKSIVGLIGAYTLEDSTISIISVYVNKKYRGQDLGKMLMEDIINQIKSTHPKKILLTVNENQKNALALYKNFGFVITSKKKSIMGDGKAYTELTMELSI